MDFAIIGTGILGTALAVRLKKAGYTCVGVNTRSPRSYDRFRSFLDVPQKSYQQLLMEARLIFITTQDAMIPEVAACLAECSPGHEEQVWIHCSGLLGSEILRSRGEMDMHCLSLHPMQAFADVETALELLPGTHFGVEGDDEELGEELVRALGGIPHPIKGENKVLYHAAAVVASNYLVTLASLAVTLLKQAGIEENDGLESLLPLMKGSITNLERVGLPQALTGPIARGDQMIVEAHLLELPPELKEIYCHLGLHTLELARAKWQSQGVDYPSQIFNKLDRLMKGYNDEKSRNHC